MIYEWVIVVRFLRVRWISFEILHFYISFTKKVSIKVYIFLSANDLYPKLKDGLYFMFCFCKASSRQVWVGNINKKY